MGFRSFIGKAATALVGLWLLIEEVPAIKRAIGIITGFDFIYEKANNPGWIGKAVHMALNPPPGTALFMVLATAALILWSIRPREKRMSLPAIGMLLSVIAFAGFGVWYLVINQTEEPKSGAAKKSSQTAETVAPVNLLPGDDGPITWYPGQYIFGATGGGDEGIKIQTFQAAGENTSDEFIQPLSGYVRSEVTGKTFPIQIEDSSGNLVSPDGLGIPAKHQFHVHAEIIGSPGITATAFMRDFGRLTFVFKYGTHTYVRRFLPEDIEAEVRRMEADLRPKSTQPLTGARRIDGSSSAVASEQPCLNGVGVDKSSDVTISNNKLGCIDVRGSARVGIDHNDTTGGSLGTKAE